MAAKTPTTLREGCCCAREQEVAVTVLTMVDLRSHVF